METPLAQTNDISTPTVLVIVPAFNEQAKIALVVADLRRHAPHADVLVIDDGSWDSTADAARAAGAGVIRLPFNLGVGGAMQTGYLYAWGSGYDVAIQFDGDGQHRADQIENLLAPMREEGVDLVIGSRLLGARSYHFSIFRWLGSRLLVGMLRMLTGIWFTDPTSGFRAASRRTIGFFSKNYPQSYLGDTVEALATAKWQGMRVREVPAQMLPARHSSIGNITGLVHTIRICIALLIDRVERRLPMPTEEDR